LESHRPLYFSFVASFYIFLLEKEVSPADFTKTKTTRNWWYFRFFQFSLRCCRSFQAILDCSTSALQL